MSSDGTMFKKMSKALKISGLFVEETSHSWMMCVYKVYRYFTIVIGLYGIIAIIHGGFISENVPYFLNVGCMQTWVFFDTVYFLLKEEEIRQFLDQIAQLDNIFDNYLDAGGSFVQNAERSNKKVQFYMNLYIISQSILPSLNGIFKFMRFLGMFGLDGEVTHLIPPLHHQNFKEHHPLIFMLDLSFQTAIITYQCLKQPVTDCFFMCIFLHMSRYFEYLHDSSFEIFNKSSHTLIEKPTLTYLRLRDNINSVLKSVKKLADCQDERITQEAPSTFDLRRLNQHQEEDKIKKWALMHQEVLK